MGAKHSKPRIRRNRRFSSIRKRQAPEGSNDPVEPPAETWNNNKPGIEECCKYCGSTDKCSNNNNTSGEVTEAKISDDVTKRKIYNGEKKTYYEEIMKGEDLKVDVPLSPECYRSCVAKEKSKSLPTKSSMQNCNKLTDHTNEEEQEWTITLYEIDKMAGRVPREDMVRLMSSIYEAVDAKVGSSPQGRKTVRVRLSVTPERNSHSRLQKSSSTPYKYHSECTCSNCPRTEPTYRRMSGEQHKVERRQRGDVSPLRRSTTVPSTTPLSKKTPNSFQQSRLPRDLSENSERRKHYAKLEGLDNNMHLHKKEKDSSTGTKNLERTNSFPHARHRTVTKYDDRQTSKHRQRHHANDQRNVMLRTRRKDPRFASPYDQHFQEAMYLRLRELQRQGALEVRKAKGGQDSDEADDDSEFEKTDEKCTGYDAGCSESKVISTLPDVLTSPHEGVENEVSSGTTSIHHHHHYHHGVPTSSVTTALSSPDSVAVKCITNAANLTCSSIVSNANGVDDPTQHHHYHHHYHHTDSNIK